MERLRDRPLTVCPHCQWPLKSSHDGICSVCNWPVYGSCIECGHVLPNGSIVMCPKCHYPTGKYSR